MSVKMATFCFLHQSKSKRSKHDISDGFVLDFHTIWSFPPFAFQMVHMRVVTEFICPKLDWFFPFRLFLGTSHLFIVSIIQSDIVFAFISLLFHLCLSFTAFLLRLKICLTNIAWTTFLCGNNTTNFESADLHQIHTLDRHYHRSLAKLDTPNEYNCSFLTCDPKDLED